MHHRGLPFAEIITAVGGSAAEDPRLSICRHSHRLGLSYGSQCLNLYIDLHLHHWKILFIQKLLSRDLEKRRIYSGWALEQVGTDFSEITLFSNEGHFPVAGYINYHNCRIRGDKNAHEIHVTPRHAQKVTVWCSLWSGGVIRPYFLEIDELIKTENGKRYRPLLTNYFWDEILEFLWKSCGFGKTMQHATQNLQREMISVQGTEHWRWRRQETAKLMRFNAVGFFVEFFWESRLYQQTCNIRQVIVEISRENYGKCRKLLRTNQLLQDVLK